MMTTPHLQKTDALLIIDPQNDFMPGGALAITHGDQIIPTVNLWIEAAKKADTPIFISRDWHPADHMSFKAQGGPWPPHCIRGTSGAQFPKDIHLPSDVIIINKAMTADKEAYSAFGGFTDDKGIPLSDKLKALGITRLWMMGLALDYCIIYSALDAINHGFETHLIMSGTRAISEDGGKKAEKYLSALGVVIELD